MFSIQPLSSYFTSRNGKICSYQSGEMTEESVNLPSATDISFNPEKFVNKIKEKQNLKESVESKIVYLLLTEL